MTVAFVTGANRGIGMATAVTLARAGHTIIAGMRNLDTGGPLQEIAAAEGLPISMAVLDVNDDASVEQAFKKAFAQHRHIDVLVNNAGISGAGSVEETPLSHFREVMETNYFGSLRCIKAVLPSMRKQRSGCIINVSSVSGRVPSAPQAPYSASKFAIETLSEILAQEMKMFNVKVAIIEPGVIDTSIVGSAARKTPSDSPYPQARRILAMYGASPRTSPYVVAEQIRDIVEGDSWRLRYPVGADAVQFIQYRASKTDEDVIAMTSSSDAEYQQFMKKEFGLDIKL